MLQNPKLFDYQQDAISGKFHTWAHRMSHSQNTGPIKIQSHLGLCMQGRFLWNRSELHVSTWIPHTQIFQSENSEIRNISGQRRSEWGPGCVLIIFLPTALTPECCQLLTGCLTSSPLQLLESHIPSFSDQKRWINIFDSWFLIFERLRPGLPACRYDYAWTRWWLSKENVLRHAGDDHIKTLSWKIRKTNDSFTESWWSL